MNAKTNIETKTILAASILGLLLHAGVARAQGDEPAHAGEFEVNASGEAIAGAETMDSEEPGDAARDESAGGSLLEISLKAGGHFPQITNDLSTNFDAILKVGLGVAAERRLQVFAELGYTQPTHEVSIMDPRLGATGATFESEMIVRDLSTALGLSYFFKDMSSLWLPYAGAALQFHFLKSEVDGSSTMLPFGHYEETSTQVGGFLFGGIGFHLGPGMILGELRFRYAPVDQKVTGDANVGALSVLLGYGLMLL